ncbi:restriction endonuclease subunit S [Sorangium sp. So ce119]|uniref:restriction endonuclease subunit S n=1 Tax=Sorangium sp. So ce119 TaxID=3133279 RepID=UPI003F6033EE
MTDGDVPTGWCTARVADLARPGEQPVLTGPFGTNLGREDFVSKGTLVLTIGCLTDAGISLGKANYVSPDKAEGLDRYRLRDGDILFSRMASVGRASIVPKALDGSLFNYHIMRLRLADSACVPQLFMHYVRGSAVVRDYLDEVNHGATRDGINTTQLLEMPVLLPPIAEQRRIVAKIDALTAKSRHAKESLDAIPALLERFRQSVLAAAFRGDLTADWREKNPDVEPAEELLKRIRAERRRRWEEAELAKMRAKGKVPGDDRWKDKYEEPAPVDASELPELPEGWAWATNEELLQFVTSGSRGWAEFYAEEGPLFIRVGNLEHHTIELDLRDIQCVKPPHGAEGVRTRVQPGDILISITADLGMVGLARDGLGEAYVNQHIALARLVTPELSEYLAHFLAAPSAGKRQLLAENRGMTKAGLGLDDILAVRVALPPAHEQVEIVRRIANVQARLSRLSQACADSNRRLIDFNRAILAKAFRGELVPQDPNDEPASVLIDRLRAEREQNGKPINGAGRRRAAASPPPALSTPAERGRRPQASRRSQTPARSRG